MMLLAKAIAYSRPTKTVGITAVDALVVTVEAFDGHVPVLADGEHTYAVLCDEESVSDPEATYETVKVVGPTPLGAPYTLTIVRNQESTDGAKEWPAGTTIACIGTSAAWSEVQRLDDEDAGINYRYALKQAGGYVILEYMEVE